jgi:hypothetical protein
LRGRELSIGLITFGSDASIPERYGLEHVTMHNAMGIDLSDFAPLMKHLARLPISGNQLKQFLLVVADDKEFVYIPPIPSATRSGLTSKNPFVMSLVSIVFSVAWERTPTVQ